MDSGFLLNASSGVLGGEDWAYAVGGGRVRGTISKRSSGSVWGEGFEEVEEEPPREENRSESLLGTTAQPSARQNMHVAVINRPF